METRIMDKAHGTRPVVFGEVLFDQFPDGHVVLGGAPFNVAWHLQAFSKAPLVISRVGNDPLGHRIRQAMEHWRMDTSGLQLDSQHPTGTVDVSFNGGEPSYDIVKDRAWDFINDQQLPPLEDMALLYHGSLALRSPQSRRAFEVMQRHDEVPVFIDINLREPWWMRDDVLSLLQRARWAKMNEDELALLLPDHNDTGQRAQSLLADYALEWMVVTLGGQGAKVFTAKGEILSITPDHATEIVDTVGAGDSFSAAVVIGLLRGDTLEAICEQANRLASYVCTQAGAMPLVPDELKA